MAVCLNRKPLVILVPSNIVGGIFMKLEDVVAVNLVDHHPQGPVRPLREMAARIITNDIEIRVYNGASREILKSLNIYLWNRDNHVSEHK
jgi:hypothetical protein